MRMEDFRKISAKAKFADRYGFVFIPKDPYGIYRKLAQIAFNGPVTAVEIIPGGMDLLKQLLADSYRYDNKSVHNYSFWFLRFIRQNLPKQFWFYSPLIIRHQKEILQAAERSREEDTYEIWVDTPGMKRKVKRTAICSNVLEALSEGRLVLPDYDTIVEAVKDEWGSKYQWGHVEKSIKKLGEGIYG